MAGIQAQRERQVGGGAAGKHGQRHVRFVERFDDQLGAGGDRVGLAGIGDGKAPESIPELANAFGKILAGDDGLVLPLPERDIGDAEILEHAPHVLDVGFGVRFAVRNDQRLDPGVGVGEEIEERGGAVRAAVIGEDDVQ